MSNSKIEEVHKLLINIASHLEELEERQHVDIRKHIDNAAATIIASIRKDIDEFRAEAQQCKCNDAILKALGKSPEKKEEEKVVSKKKQPKQRGWYPENLGPQEFKTVDYS